jgi:hypothetical protein
MHVFSAPFNCPLVAMVLAPAAWLALAMARVAGAASAVSAPPLSSSFEFVSVVHVNPAPNTEGDARGFHTVIVGTAMRGAAQRHQQQQQRQHFNTTQSGSATPMRVAWATGIRGELVAIDITDVVNPIVVYVGLPLFVNSDAFVNTARLHTHVPLECSWYDSYKHWWCVRFELSAALLSVWTLLHQRMRCSHSPSCLQSNTHAWRHGPRYNHQDPGPTAHLYNSRTLMWLPGTCVRSLNNKPLFVT